MCEIYQEGIEHPNQDTWIRGYSEHFGEDRLAELARRYEGLSSAEIELDSLAAAVDSATLINYSYRAMHEGANRGLLGIGAKDEVGPQGVLRAEYDDLTGRAEKVSDFVLWFSTVSHKAFVAAEQLPEDERFKHVSLELGGMRQFGDWEATGPLDDMARRIPRGVLAANPDARMTLYDHRKVDGEDDERITYTDAFKKSYRLLPQYRLPSAHDKHMSASAFEDEDIETRAAVAFDYTVVRRRRPIADIYVPGQSDLVIFKESIGLLVMSMIEPKMRVMIVDDCRRVFQEARATQDLKGVGSVKLDDTPGARLAGNLFETAINSRAGVTRDIIPISAHYVQGVGEKFARFRKAQQETS